MNGLTDYQRMLAQRAHQDASAAYQGYSAEALMAARYGAGSGSPSSMAGVDPVLLQEMRRQELMAAAAAGHGTNGRSSASAYAHPAHSGSPPMADQAHSHAKAAVLARREEELLRIRDEHNRIMEAELAARAMRDRVAAEDERRALQAQLRGLQEARGPHAQGHGHQGGHQAAHGDSLERIVALQEQQRALARQREQLRQAEADRAAFGAQGLQRQPSDLERLNAAYGSSNPRALNLATNGSSSSAQMAEEAALREQFIRRRLMEEEAANRQRELHAAQQAHQAQQQAHQAQAQQQPQASHQGSASSADREHLDRLIHLQQMSDEDLIRRAAEIQQGAQEAERRAQDRSASALRERELQESMNRSKNLELERRAMEAQFLRNRLNGLQGGGNGLQGGLQGGGGGLQGGGGADSRLDMIDQAAADAAVLRRMSGERSSSRQGLQAELRGLQTSPSLRAAVNNQQLGGSQHSNMPSSAVPKQPLRFFNNGVEVDMDGNPLPPSKAASPAQQQAALMNSQGPALNNMLGGGSSNSSSMLDHNIIAKFLTVVVSRVPEIAPAVADLLPDGADPARLRQEFPHVVEATLAELKSIQERIAKANEPNAVELHSRVTDCIAAIEPYKVDMNAAGILAPLPGSLPQGRRRGSGTQDNNMGDMRQGLPEPIVDPNACQPLMPNSSLKAAAMSATHSSSNGLPKESKSYSPSTVDPQAARESFERSKGKKTKGSAKKSVSPAEDSDDDMPMMAAHKAHKKALKKKAKKKRWKSIPKLVHKAVKGEETMGEDEKKSAESQETGADGKSSECMDASQIAVAALTSIASGSVPAVVKRKASDGSANSAHSGNSSNSKQSSNSSTTSSSGPMKKRRISEELLAKSNDDLPQETDSPSVDTSALPVNGMYQKKGRVRTGSFSNVDVPSSSNAVSNAAGTSASGTEGRHVALLDQLLGAAKSADLSSSSSSAAALTSSSNEGKRDEEPSSSVENKEGEATPTDPQSAMITDESEHKEGADEVGAGNGGSAEDVDEEVMDEHLGAASVLLGLIKGK